MLTKIINNVLQLETNEVYLLSVVRWGTEDKQPTASDEARTYGPLLRQKLATIQPHIVVGLGLFASQALLQTDKPMAELRGRVHPFDTACLVPTYDPAYLLSNPGEKRKVFEDMKLVRIELEQRTGRTLAPIGRAREDKQ